MMMPTAIDNSDNNIFMKMFNIDNTTNTIMKNLLAVGKSTKNRNTSSEANSNATTAVPSPNPPH